MKKFILGIIIIFVGFFVNSQVFAEEQTLDEYVVQNFSSEITLLRDTELLIKETIVVNFPYLRHGIYRIIPTIYSTRGKTINTKFQVVNITDEKGAPYPYTSSRLGKSIQLKIGDPNVEVKDINTYVITYKVNKVIQRFEDHDELYWNALGHEWDTGILAASVRVSSPYAAIKETECFSGSFGGSDRFCKKDNSEVSANFTSTTELGNDKDLTIVVGFDKNNDLIFPSTIDRFFDNFLDNWAYVPSIIPLLSMFFFWYRNGRDRRYISDMIYYTPDDTKERDVTLFEKEYISFVYHPIEGISPSEAGTIIDEKVDIADVIAEITELARLGYLEIRKIEKKKLIGKEVDFAFIKTKLTDNEKDLSTLKEYQKYLLKEVFRATSVHRSVKLAEDLFKGNHKELDEARRLLAKKEYVLLSGLKNHFYEGLPVFKQKLYERMKSEQIFSDNPEGVRTKWIGVLIALTVLAGAITFTFFERTGNFGPMIMLGLFSLPAFAFALSMPRRTSKGYSFYRQIQGLRWYLNKGKWRHEQSEKNLFIESVLPLAISLGVVDQLAQDMKELDIKPPSYFAGSNPALFYGDFSTFRSTSTRNFLSAPGGKWSGSSSWSGGSGFSGGSSGGGFGGGGGGSW